MDVILKEGIDLLNEIGAKQSTSEEILEKVGSLAPSVEGRFFKCVNTGMITSAQTTTALNITGKGKFMGCVFTTAHNTSKTDVLTLTVDGTPHTLTAKISNPNGTPARYLCVLPNVGFSSYSSTSNNNYFFFRGVAVTSDRGISHASFGDTATYPDNSNGGSIVVTFDNAIPFEDSLKLEVVSRGTNSKCVSWYTLEE